jgi:hypothetical protein
MPAQARVSFCLDEYRRGFKIPALLAPTEQETAILNLESLIYPLYFPFPFFPYLTRLGLPLLAKGVPIFHEK